LFPETFNTEQNKLLARIGTGSVRVRGFGTIGFGRFYTEHRRKYHDYS